MNSPEMNNAAVRQTTACDVVVVNYNGGDFLQRCVESVYSSDLAVSLKIVDNASVDDSLSKVEALTPGVHHCEIIRNTDNLGFSKAVNLGAKAGEAAYVLLLNPDCEIHPHTIRNLLTEAAQHDDLGIMGALVFNEDGTEQRGCRRLEPTFTRSMVTALRLGKYFKSVNLQHQSLPAEAISLDAVSGSAMLIKREVFEALGGMDEGYFLHVEDLDICRRVREFGKKVYFTPNVSLFHHHGASSHAVPYRTEWHKHQGMLRYHSKFQMPNQSWLRSTLTQGVIYMNFALSILRKQLSRFKVDKAMVVTRLISDQAPLLITGASSDLGQAVLQNIQPGQAVIAVSRGNKFPDKIGEEIWFSWTFFEKAPAQDFIGAAAWLALSPVWSASEMAKTLQRFAPLERVIAMSSTSIMGKSQTADSREQNVVQKLIQGEQSLQQWAEAQGSVLTICRASMVYGGAHNQNIAFMQRFMKWLRFFPMISAGQGLRQPVHVEDLAMAVGQLRERTDLPEHVYVLAGGERISYREMVERVFRAQGQTPRIWVMPKGLFMGLARMVSWLPGLHFINPEMVVRMENDMVYDIDPAQRDFGYSPGKFRP